MTVNQHYPLPNYGTPSGAHVDDDEATSPSDGYFGQRSSVPSTVFIANPESQPDAAMSKAKEANAGKGSSLTTHQTIYTPDTTATPAGSSRRDSSSTYNGYGSRYPEAVPNRDDDPPPMYSDTPTNWSQGQHSPTTAQPQVQHRDAPASTRVGPIPPPRVSISARNIGTCRSPRPAAQSMSDHPEDVLVTPDDESPLLPISRRGRSRRHGCCGGRRHQRREGRRNTRGWFGFAVGAVLIIWLVAHLVKYIHQEHTRVRIPQPTIPPNPNTSKPIPQPSRSYRQVETSSSISGTYELLDLLDLSTTSGSISITVIPKPAGPDNAPAVLTLRSTSGSINVRFSPSAGTTPDRLYQTSLSTQSGGISGTLTVNGAGEGGKASINTRSGSINVNVFPILSPNASTQYTGAATLHTSSNTGSQSVTIKSPNRPGYLTDLAGSHTAVGSASLNIAYPREWKGIVHAKSNGSGSVNVKGEGLEYQLKSSREVYAWRGKSGEEVETVEILGKGSGIVGFGC